MGYWERRENTELEQPEPILYIYNIYIYDQNTKIHNVKAICLNACLISMGLDYPQ